MKPQAKKGKREIHTHTSVKRMRKEPGVIINVYVESRILQSEQKTVPIKKINRTQFSSQPRVSKMRGYDRRAQLLAYAQELRHANAQELQWSSFKNSNPKPKRTIKNGQKWRWGVAVEKIKRLFLRFDVTKREQKYESIVTEDYSDGEGSCDKEMTKTRKKKNSRKGRRNSHLCKKLWCLLKEISRTWKCKNGGC